MKYTVNVSVWGSLALICGVLCRLGHTLDLLIRVALLHIKYNVIFIFRVLEFSIFSLVNCNLLIQPQQDGKLTS